MYAVHSTSTHRSAHTCVSPHQTKEVHMLAKQLLPIIHPALYTATFIFLFISKFLSRNSPLSTNKKYLIWSLLINVTLNTIKLSIFKE